MFFKLTLMLYGRLWKKGPTPYQASGIGSAEKLECQSRTETSLLSPGVVEPASDAALQGHGHVELAQVPRAAVHSLTVFGLEEFEKNTL